MMKNHSVIGLLALAVGIACVLSIASSVLIMVYLPSLGSATQAFKFLIFVAILAEIAAGVLSLVSLFDKKRKTFCIAAVAFNGPFFLLCLGFTIYAVIDIYKRS